MSYTGVRQQFDLGVACAKGSYCGIFLAVLLPVLVFLIQWRLWDAIQPYAWFLFYPTVFLSVLLGRLWGGILSTLLSTLLVWYFFIPPEYGFAIPSFWALLSIIVFASSGIVFSFFYEHLYLSHSRDALQAGDARFQLLFEQAMDGIMITGAGGLFLEVNSRFCALSGYSREELLGKNIAALLPKSDIEKIRECFASGAALSTQPSEWTLLTKEGVSCPVEVTAGQFSNGCWSAIVRDIRDRRQAEAQERAAEEKFHVFMDAIPALAWIKDGAGNYVYRNKAWSQAFGVNQAALPGKPGSIQMPASVAAGLSGNDAALFATGNALELDEEAVDFNGRLRLWKSIRFPIHTAENSMLLGGVAIDITEQQQSAAALQASAELNRAVLDSVSSQMAVLDRDGIIIAVNDAWRRFARAHSGSPEQEARTGIGINFLEVCRQQGALGGGGEGAAGDEIYRALLELLRGKSERFSCECLCDTETGRLWFNLNITPLQSPADGAVVSYFDITEIKRSQEMQQVATAQLKAMSAKHLAVQEEERLMLSRELHDHIGQILTSLQLNLHALRAEVKESSRGRWIVHEAISGVDNLVGTTRDIARRLRPPALDDLGLASAVRWHVNQIASSSSMALDLQQNLDGVRLAPAIELACFRVLQEAISNALRHSQATKLSIALSLELDGLHLSVKDDGQGFSVDETFKRLHHLASLGLIGMRERVANLGGRFSIDSIKGQGTTVAAYFPLPP